MSDNIFQGLIDQLEATLKSTRMFMGAYTNKKGKFKILKDTNGKPIWYATGALIYNEFMAKLSAKDPEFQSCSFYAISGSNYIHHRLMIHGYEAVDVRVTPDMMYVLHAIPLEFHKKVGLGLFVPVTANLDKLHALTQKDPTMIFHALNKAKKLVLEETKPCCSCGTLCHVPDLSENKNLSDTQKEDIISLVEDNKVFCFDCGIKFISSTAKYKAESFTDTAEVQQMNQLIAKCESMDLSKPDFDYNAAQGILQDLMSRLSSVKMTVVDGADVKSVKLSKKVVNKISPWLN